MWAPEKSRGGSPAADFGEHFLNYDSKAVTSKRTLQTGLGGSTALAGSGDLSTCVDSDAEGRVRNGVADAASQRLRATKDHLFLVPGFSSGREEVPVMRKVLPAT